MFFVRFSSARSKESSSSNHAKDRQPEPEVEHAREGPHGLCQRSGDVLLAFGVIIGLGHVPAEPASLAWNHSSLSTRFDIPARVLHHFYPCSLSLATPLAGRLPRIRSRSSATRSVKGSSSSQVLERLPVFPPPHVPHRGTHAAYFLQVRS